MRSPLTIGDDSLSAARPDKQPRANVSAGAGGDVQDVDLDRNIRVARWAGELRDGLRQGVLHGLLQRERRREAGDLDRPLDRKSTRLNSSH